MKWSELTHEQLDALIAEKVFQREIIPMEHLGSTRLLMGRQNKPGLTEVIPHYSADMNAAWQIVDRYDEIIISKHVPYKYYCELWKSTTRYTSTSRNPQEAICLAALKSCGVEIEE